MTDFEKKQQRMGTGMMIVAWALALVVLTYFFQGVTDSAENPNQQVLAKVDKYGRHQIILKANRQHHYVASGSINGYNVKFLVDTGATTVSVPKALADKIGLKRGMAITVNTAGGTVTAYTARIKKLTLGSLKFHDVRATINPHDSSGSALLGMTVLRQVELRQHGNQLILTQEKQ